MKNSVVEKNIPEKVEVEHTPGPWHPQKEIISKRGRDYGRITVLAKSGHYITTEVCASSHDILEVERNADLIAAAPDMLAALKKAVAFIGETQEYKTGHTGAGNIMREAVAVIAKASGGAA